MSYEYPGSFLFVVLITIGIIFIGLAIFFVVKIVSGAVDSSGQLTADKPPELKCLEFNDGRLAVIKVNCKESESNVSWFLSKGYHIDSVPIWSPGTSYETYGYVYMSR